MPCANPDGTLVVTARRLLEAADPPGTAADIAGRTGLPLYRVRSGLRELLGAGLITEGDGAFFPTPAGRDRLATP